MTDVLCDASVVAKWFHDEETETAEARRLVAAHRAGSHRLRVLDLTYYELGNFLTRRLGAGPDRTRAALGALSDICGIGIALSPSMRDVAAAKSVEHRLTFYDAAYWAASVALGMPLVTADRELVEAGAGAAPATFASPLGSLTPR